MKGIRLAILLGFTLMFAAGLAIGRAPKPVPAKPAERSWLGDELNLSADQQQRVKKIWSDVNAGQDFPKLFHENDAQRDQAYQALLTDEQKAQFAQIKKDHDAKAAAIQAGREKVMHEAEDKTRQLLNDEQKAKYEQILKDHSKRRGPPGGIFRGPPPGPRPGPQTAPSK